HECEKSGHHRPLPPPQDRRRIRAQREHIKNIAPHPALTGEGGGVELDPILLGRDPAGGEIVELVAPAGQVRLGTAIAVTCTQRLGMSRSSPRTSSKKPASASKRARRSAASPAAITSVKARFYGLPPNEICLTT